jgi:hypothetical protein
LKGQEVAECDTLDASARNISQAAGELQIPEHGALYEPACAPVVVCAFELFGEDIETSGQQTLTSRERLRMQRFHGKEWFVSTIFIRTNNRNLEKALSRVGAVVYDEIGQCHSKAEEDGMEA